MSKKMLMPNSDRVLLEFFNEEQIGLIAIPEMYQEAQSGVPRKARVVAVGPGKFIFEGELMPPDFIEGEIVLVDPIGGMKIDLDGKKYLLVRQEEILGTIVDLKDETEKPTLTSV